MKLWLKYLIGIGVGLVLALILPPSSVQSQATLDFIVDLVIRVGRYTLVPVLFFSVAVSAFKLRDEKQLYRTTAWTLGVIVASSLGLMLLGLIAASKNSNYNRKNQRGCSIYMAHSCYKNFPTFRI